MNIQKTTTFKPKEAEDKLGFGRVFSDHMFIMDAIDEVWQDERIVPHGPIALDPAATVLHYSQEVFEGLKAYRASNKDVLLFRAMDNLKRMNISAKRLCMPEFDVDKVFEALVELVKLEESWVPNSKGTSLYIRPNMMGVDSKLGVDKAKHVMFYIICSPSGAYYSTGLAPVKIYVEDQYVRAVRGGMGYTKTGGNYAASLIAGVAAHEKGFNQVMWLDGVERKYVEEVGSMNMFFLFNDELVTPQLQGSILDGITRRSIITLAKEFGLKVTERHIEIEEIYNRSQKGELLEAFGSGTAAVVSPVGELFWQGKTITINNFEIGKVTQKFYDTLTGIQYGDLPDNHGWVTRIKM